ncbi:DinB family protein [Populibacterium corticicola]|uniref:DinB family protein n=1 Tax=Populibacterium corticicola TaxID=1812826 RepID=A0ABW5XE87_9MICO
MSITPDTKDWTWVIEQECPDCGFNASLLTLDQIGDTARAQLPHWREVLTREDVRERPNPGVWSALEYAAHVRDVHKVMLGRLNLMLTQDNPGFPNWDQDEAAETGNYAAQDPQQVLADLEANAEEFAAAYDAVEPTHADRTGLRSNGSHFTVLTLGRYAAHDLVHHVWDTRN